MSYLDRVYRAIGFKPLQSAASVASLERIEDLLGRSLPSAVREWYSNEEAVEIMVSRTSDRAVPLSDLGAVVANWYGDGPRDFLDHGQLFVMRENQGVCNWVVDLADGDDPQVLVEVDSSPNHVWQLYSPHFSEWVYTLLTDWAPKNSPMLCAQDIELAPSDLGWLRDHLNPG